MTNQENPKMFLVQFIFNIEVDAFDHDEAYEFAKDLMSLTKTSDWDDCRVMELGDVEDTDDDE